MLMFTCNWTEVNKILFTLISLNQDQARQNVEHDLGPNCLLKLLAEDTRR